MTILAFNIMSNKLRLSAISFNPVSLSLYLGANLDFITGSWRRRSRVETSQIVYGILFYIWTCPLSVRPKCIGPTDRDRPMLKL